MPVYYPPNDREDDGDDETARLRAALAELLTFAENALRFAESVGDEYGAQQARAVIAKANFR